MADILQRLRGEVPGLRGQLSERWGANHADGRLLIRRALTAELGGPPQEDLTLRPQLPEWSLSISHTQDYGGWIAVPSPGRLYSIGLDIERRERLNREILARVCTFEELAAAPDPAFLWVAKEACYKALAGPLQPKTMVEVRVHDWSPQFALWSFAHQGGRGRGWVATDQTRLYAVYLL